jgi:hypothetical protein
MKMIAFWLIASCSLVVVGRSFRGRYFIIALMMEAVCTSEMPVSFNVTTRRYTTED